MVRHYEDMIAPRIRFRVNRCKTPCANPVPIQDCQAPISPYCPSPCAVGIGSCGLCPCPVPSSVECMTITNNASKCVSVCASFVSSCDTNKVQTIVQPGSVVSVGPLSKTNEFYKPSLIYFLTLVSTDGFTVYYTANVPSTFGAKLAATINPDNTVSFAATDSCC